MSITLADVENREKEMETGKSGKIPSPATFLKKNKMVIYAAGGVLLLVGAYWAYNKVIKKAKTTVGSYVPPKAATVVNPSIPVV